MISETFNQVVLSVGLETPKFIIELAERLEIDLTKGNFCKTKTFTPVETSREGIFICGVFVCKCGINIAGIVDVPAVTEYSSGLPYVEYAENNLFTCSQDTQETITRVIREQNLNRVVVAACTPKTHEPMFQETLINAGLNKYLFEFVNIRNHDSWVHRAYPELATEKAKDLVRWRWQKLP